MRVCDLLKILYDVLIIFEFFIDLDLLSCFQWMICYLLSHTYAQLEMLKSQNKDLFTAKNDSQMFFARNLSIVFGEVNIYIVLIIDLKNNYIL